MADREEFDAWPRGLGEVAGHANPADPTLPMAPPRDDTEVRIAATLARQLPYYGSSDLKPIQFAEAYARLCAVAVARAEFYGQLLARHYEDSDLRDFHGEPTADTGATGLVGFRYDLDKQGNAIPIGEEIRALVKLEAEERDRAAKLIRDGVRLGIEAKQVDVMRSYGHTVVAALKALCVQLGIPWEDEARLAAQRAILAARTGLGYAITAPRTDDAGAV